MQIIFYWLFGRFLLYPRIDQEALSLYYEGLVCLSGCFYSRLAYEIFSGSRESLIEQINWHRTLFGDDYYLELQRHEMSERDLQDDGIYQESWLYQQYQGLHSKTSRKSIKR